MAPFAIDLMLSKIPVLSDFKEIYDAYNDIKGGPVGFAAELAKLGLGTAEDYNNHQQEISKAKLDLILNTWGGYGGSMIIKSDGIFILDNMIPDLNGANGLGLMIDAYNYNGL